MFRQHRYLLICWLLLLAACKSSISPNELYGKWNYTKLERPHASTQQLEPDWKLKLEHPYILFTKTNELEIWWSGEKISHGTFTTKGSDIIYKEILDGGQAREFPFHVTRLEGNMLIFETDGEEGSRVTAVIQ